MFGDDGLEYRWNSSGKDARERLNKSTLGYRNLDAIIGH